MSFDKWIKKNAPPSYLAGLSAEALGFLREAYEAGADDAECPRCDSDLSTEPEQPKPGIKFRGGPKAGERWPVCPLVPLNGIDPWDDRTIAAHLASPMVPMDEFRVDTMRISDDQTPSEPALIYRYSGDRDGDDYVYDFVKAL